MKDLTELLERVLRSGNPILFTGAGFNHGADRGKSKTIPMGEDLKIYILQNILGYKEDSEEYRELLSESLTDICDLCENNDAARLKDYLTEMFTDCHPTEYHKTIAKYPWQKIYTTNIDDLLENTYDTDKLLVQNMDRPKAVPMNGRIEYVKLHGCVRNQSYPYIFSHKAYVDSMLQSKDYRFSQFGQDIQYNNFIFVGTNYDEIDLDFYLQMYENSVSVSGKGNLIFINPSSSIVFKRKLERYGAKLINWKTEDLAKFIEDKGFLGKEESPVISPKSFYFLNEHVGELKKTTAYRSNLYLGFEPTWQDIIKDWDFYNRHILSNFKMFYEDMHINHIYHCVFSLIGKAMSGKSIYLKRLGYFLFQEGFIVLEYVGKRFDPFELTNYCRKNKLDRLCLIVDNGSFYYGAFKSLLHSIPASTELIILSSSRPYFHSRKLYNIVTENYFEYTIPHGIDGIFAEEISKKLYEKGYLGELKKLNGEERKKAINKSNDVPNLLYNITYGTGFVQKFREDLNLQLPKMVEGSKNLLLILSIFEKLELSYFPLELVTLLFGKNTKGILKEVEDFVKYDGFQGISLRNSNIANMIISRRQPKKIFSRIKEILINISPQVNEGRHTYWNEIEASLMKEKLLRQKLGLKTPAIRNMLFEIQSFYNDSYNYWIQIGISEQMENEFDKALNHFKQAEAINPESYMVKNAIARNFLKQANSLSSYESARPYFDQGRELMLQLIKEREEFQVKAYSTHCYLYEKMNFYLKFKIQPDDKELRDMYDMLKSIISKTSSEDGMSKHISNKFYNFLRTYNKTKIVSVDFHDLKDLRVLIADSGVDIEQVFEDFEIDE